MGKTTGATSMTTMRCPPWDFGGECLGGIGLLLAKLTMVQLVGPGLCVRKERAIWVIFL